MTAKPRVLLVHGLWSSARTWWRVGPELEARGWDVVTVALAGHGGRPIGPVRSIAELAADVAHHHPEGGTLVVGHSLGAVVALELATSFPAYAAGVLLEDPPGRGGDRAAADRADDYEREGIRALDDQDAAMASLLWGHPTWSRRDARSVVEGRLLTDPALARLSPGDLAWDLPAMVAACRAPVGLVASRGRYSALAEPQRSDVLRLLAPERVTEVPGSHHVHLDEPKLWVDAVDTFGRSLT